MSILNHKPCRIPLKYRHLHKTRGLHTLQSKQASTLSGSVFTSVNIWFSVAHTIHHQTTLITLQSLGGNQGGCQMTLAANWQVMKTTLINMAHQFWCHTKSDGKCCCHDPLVHHEHENVIFWHKHIQENPKLLPRPEMWNKSNQPEMYHYLGLPNSDQASPSPSTKSSIALLSGTFWTSRPNWPPKRLTKYLYSGWKDKIFC